MKSFLKIFSYILVAFIVYLLLYPVNIVPKAWTPDPAPEMTGIYAPNEKLQAIQRFQAIHGEGPEDIVIDTAGNIYAGLSNGKIIRFESDGSNPTVFSETGGRPLGMAFDSLGNLIVADGEKGLLLVDAEGGVIPLTTAYKGQPYHFVDDLDIASDGKIYFSDASMAFGVRNWKDDFMAHSESGRLFVYDPERKQTQLLLSGLSFANGVALGPDDAYVLVNETASYRITKFWIEGPKGGSSEVLVENLPGFPDNISFNEKGTFWVAIANPRNDLLDKMLPYPFLRKVVHRLPDAVQPAPVRYGFVLGINEKGEIIENLQDPQGGFAPITSAKEMNGYLYLGSLTELDFARIDRH